MPPALYESEVAFVSGVDANGKVAETAYATWRTSPSYPSNPPDYGTTSEAAKWGNPTPGTGATVTYWFTATSAWTDAEQAAWEGGMALWSAVANIRFVEAASEDATNFQIKRGTDGKADQLFGSYPYSSVGDSTLGTPPATDPNQRISIDTTAPSYGPIGPDMDVAGGYPLSTVLHELGHMIGLGHGGPYDGSVNALTQQFSAYDTTLWTLMSYITPTDPAKFFDDYPVAGTDWGVNSTNDPYGPLTPMMLDILAVQRLYGVRTTGPLSSGNHTFGFNANIEGYIGRFYDFRINQNPVLTIWDGGINNTLDLSGFTQDAVVSLLPGSFSSAGGKVNNIGIAVGTVIETAIGGNGNDRMTASDVASWLKGGAGNDILSGGVGNDRLEGGAGVDMIFGGPGNDTISGGAQADYIDFGTGFGILRDSLADMNGDTITGLGVTNVLGFSGSLIGRANLGVTIGDGSATLGAGPVSFQLNGTFAGGDFMAVARGSGADAHTTVSFVPYLPTLAEGVRVNPASINGIANEPYLTGDGAVQFTLQFGAAVSAFSNALGYYKVAGNGSILDVNMLFANTLSVAAGASINLGAPANNERIGFFLVQDGFDFFGSLPDNLSFVTEGSLAPGNLNTGQPLLLSSASLGLLSGASIFHSFATLNPGDAVQVLSGVTPGGRELRIGFEDLPSTTGDNDFQDVVVSIRVNADDYFIL